MEIKLVQSGPRWHSAQRASNSPPGNCKTEAEQIEAFNADRQAARKDEGSSRAFLESESQMLARLNAEFWIEAR